jgi:hypothetical protein
MCNYFNQKITPKGEILTFLRSKKVNPLPFLVQYTVAAVLALLVVAAVVHYYFEHASRVLS